MSEEKNNFEIESIYSELLKMGYEDKTAKSVAEDVFKAKRNLRLEAVKKYINKRVSAEFSGLTFEVVVNDVKITDEGKVAFQVKPLNGNRMAWVDKIIL